MERFLINDCNLRQPNDSIARISVAATPPLILVKISVRPVMVPCTAWQKQAQEKGRKKDSAARLRCGPRGMEV